MKMLIVLILTFLLLGCNTVGKLLDVAADVNDESLLSAEFTICHAASVGSVIRRYGTTDKAKAWRELCTTDSDAIPIIIHDN